MESQAGRTHSALSFRQGAFYAIASHALPCISARFIKGSDLVLTSDDGNPAKSIEAGRRNG
jgi:hypothetical protein